MADLSSLTFGFTVSEYSLVEKLLAVSFPSFLGPVEPPGSSVPSPLATSITSPGSLELRTAVSRRCRKETERTLEALESETRPRRETAEKEQNAGEAGGLRSLSVGRRDGDDAIFLRRVTKEKGLCSYG